MRNNELLNILLIEVKIYLNINQLNYFFREKNAFENGNKYVPIYRIIINIIYVNVEYIFLNFYYVYNIFMIFFFLSYFNINFFFV